MWAAIFFSLFLLTAAAFAIVYRLQRRGLAALGKARDKLQLEELRVFDFLRGLGTALSASSGPSDLHVLIVEGALRILDARGGALYLQERGGTQLRPTFVSRSCPPFFPVPEEQRTQLGFSWQWQSFLRLHVIAAGEGLVGAAFTQRAALRLSPGDPRLDVLRTAPMKPGSAMIGPLLYGDENLGVLAIARGEEDEPFSENEFEIFKTIAEQSAFALHNATIFSEAAEKRRLDQDLQVAYEIQRILLPASAPEFEGFQISGINIPAQQVSGDYFDYVKIDDQRIGVAIADVSGKGVPASLIMAMCRSVLRGRALAQHSPAAVLREVNSQLFPDIKEDMFISMAYAILDRSSATVTLCRAGHDAPLLYRARDGSVSRINPPGMALGIDSGDVFNRITSDFLLDLEPDDCLVLYTDGVTEALDAQGDEFGLARVTQAIQASAPEGAARIVSRVTDDLRSFVGNQPPHDDITLIAIRKK